MSRYLITGGAGFIGSHLAETLTMEGHELWVLDDLSGSALVPNVDGKCIEGSVTDATLVNHLMASMDGCFHLASKSSDSDCEQTQLDAHHSNLIGSINVLSAAARFRVPVVYGSSATVYGDNAALRLKENATPRPRNAAGADKLAIEHHAVVAALRGSIPVTGLRFFNVYGSRGTPDSNRQGVVERFVNRLLDNEVVTIYGDGQQIRDFVYVKDAVRFLVGAMQLHSPVHSLFNVCTGEAVSINQVARAAMSILNLQLPIVHEQARPADIWGYVGDPSLAARKLGMTTDYSIADGLLDFINQRAQQVAVAPSRARDYEASSQACFLR